jgi:hypothetical protein
MGGKYPFLEIFQIGPPFFEFKIFFNPFLKKIRLESVFLRRPMRANGPGAVLSGRTRLFLLLDHAQGPGGPA